MNAQVGEPYRCSDSNWGCEIEVTSAGRTQDESYGASSVNTRVAKQIIERKTDRRLSHRRNGSWLAETLSPQASPRRAISAHKARPERCFRHLRAEIRALPYLGVQAQPREALSSPVRRARSAQVPPTLKPDRSANQILLCLRTADAQGAALQPCRTDVIPHNSKSELAFKTISGSQILPPSVAGASFPSHTKIPRCELCGDSQGDRSDASGHR